MSEKIIFAGTPDFAAEHLKALIEAKYNIIAVYTQPDRPSGRGHKLTPSPVKSLALEHNIPVFTPVNFKEEADKAQFESLQADLAVVVAYGLILPERILTAPRLGCINVHGSLLPQWRGAAPIQRALLSGQDKTGVTIMKIVKELDAGDMLYKKEIEITSQDTSETLFERLATCGSQALVEAMPKILAQELVAQKQDSALVTYAQKLSKDESPLNFNHSAKQLSLQVRGLNPWPVATTTFDEVVYKVFLAQELSAEQVSLLGKIDDLENGAIVQVSSEGITVKCAEGCLLLQTIQAPGKGRVSAGDFARSKKDLFVRGKCFA